MIQPQLGKKISELRKSRGLTQEELVEKCNVSVRTLQRIEGGEVTPRPYTVRMLLAALNADESTITWSEDHPLPERGSSFLKSLEWAWICGIGYFVLRFVEAASEYDHYFFMGWHSPTWVYVLVKLSVLATFAIFINGFHSLGRLFRISLLKTSAVLLVITLGLILIYDIVTAILLATGDLWFDDWDRAMTLALEGALFGAAGLIFGLSLLQLSRQTGRTTKLAALFQIITSICFVTVILIIPALILEMPTEILMIAVLYNISDSIKTRNGAMKRSEMPVSVSS